MRCCASEDDAQNFKPSYPSAASTPRTAPVSSRNKGKLACVRSLAFFSDSHLVLHQHR